MQHITGVVCGLIPLKISVWCQKHTRTRTHAHAHAHTLTYTQTATVQISSNTEL